MCMEFKLEESGIEINVPNTKNKVLCPKPVLKEGEKDVVEDQIVEVKLKNGAKMNVKCPNYQIFKDTFKLTDCPDFCHGNGFCSNGGCECFDGFD